MRKNTPTIFSCTRGFSLAEVISVFAIVAVSAAVILPVVQPAVREMRLSEAADKVTMEIRRGRQGAVDFRRLHRVSFIGSGTIRLERQDLETSDWVPVHDTFLPQGVVFDVPQGAPTGDDSPDEMGTSQSVDFSGRNSVIFHPDGSARGNAGEIVSGIVYVRRADKPEHGRAVTLFGATGRVKPWRLIEDSEGGQAQWK